MMITLIIFKRKWNTTRKSTTTIQRILRATVPEVAAVEGVETMAVEEAEVEAVEAMVEEAGAVEAMVEEAGAVEAMAAVEEPGGAVEEGVVGAEEPGAVEEGAFPSPPINMEAAETVRGETPTTQMT